MKILLATMMLLLGAAAAHACNVPNPNLTPGTPPSVAFVDGCDMPAAALNAAINAASKANTIYAPVAQFGAKGDGVTDDTAAIQAAAASLTGGGTVFFAPGHYCIKTGPITTSVPGVTFEGQNSGGGNGVTPPNTNAAVVLDACGIDVSVFNISGRHDKISNLKIIGSQKVGTTNPAVTLSGGAGGCNECRIVDSYVTGGSNAVNAANGYEIWLLGNSFDTVYGNAAVYLGTVGGYILNNKLDQAYPGGTPAAGTAAPTNWVSNHAYSTGAMAIVGSYIIQATIGGTSSSGSAPVVLPYGTNIVDGTVTWRLLGNSTYYGIQCDTGCGSNLFIEDNDLSSVFTTAIALTNTLSGTAPHFITISRNTFGADQTGFISLTSGNGVTISDNNMTYCVITGCSAISATTPFAGDLNITNNQMYGTVTGTMTGIFLGNGVYRTTIVANQIGNTTTAISVAAGTQEFTITGNELGGSSSYGNNTTAINVASGSSDNYTISGNNTTGATLTDGGSGVHKVVIDGNAGYARVNHLLGAGPAPTITAGFCSSPSITGNDTAGRITIGSTGSCNTGTITFGTAWASNPRCVANDETHGILTRAAAGPTTMAFGTDTVPTNWTNGDTISYVCIGN